MLGVDPIRPAEDALYRKDHREQHAHRRPLQVETARRHPQAKRGRWVGALDRHNLDSTFARSLSSTVGRIVEDRTGLQGYYALTLTTAVTARPGADAAPDPGNAPSIFTALEEQLGLKLEPATKPLQTVVIDHIELPTEN